MFAQDWQCLPAKANLFWFIYSSDTHLSGCESELEAKKITPKLWSAQLPECDAHIDSAPIPSTETPIGGQGASLNINLLALFLFFLSMAWTGLFKLLPDDNYGTITITIYLQYHMTTREIKPAFLDKLTHAN